MKIEAGKSYRTRDGRKVKVRQSDHRKWPFIGGVGSEGGNAYFEADGTAPHLPHFDLISEWADGPVRTVTRWEIVEGEFDLVRVHNPGSKYVRIDVGAKMGVAELRAAAAVMLELAEALDE